MAALAVGVALDRGRPLREPENVLGPAWTQGPLLVISAFLIDVIPRALYRSRWRFHMFFREARGVIDEHWTRRRVTLVVLGLTCFFITYVSYRNLKNLLPFVRPIRFDYAMHHIDRAIFFGHDPALVLQDLLGTHLSATLLSWVYLAFLPLVPITVTVWAVWSRTIRYGYWFLTADCICWSLGTLSYYLIPTLGPNFVFPWLYSSIKQTGVSSLQDQLAYSREEIIHASPFASGIQSVAGFASLHVGITLMTVVIAHYTVRHRVLRWGMWTYLVLVVISTTYFGWHYVLDDLAGVVIALVSAYAGAYLTGHRFDRRLRLLPLSQES